MRISLPIKAPGVVAAPAPSLPVTVDQLPRRLCSSTIIRVEASGNHCQVITRNGRRYTITTTLSTVAQLVPGFWRVHRSHLVNPAYVLGTVGLVRHRGMLRLSSGEQLPVSRRRKEGVCQQLKQLVL